MCCIYTPFLTSSKLNPSVSPSNMLHGHVATPPPPSVSVRQVTARSVTLSLSSCTSSPTDGTLTYAVKYNTSTGQELIAETSGSNLTIEHLLAGVDYTFTVTCNNEVGLSGSSISVPVTTKSEGLCTDIYEQIIMIHCI